jgi:hypothetical protein
MFRVICKALRLHHTTTMGLEPGVNRKSRRQRR